VSTIQVLRWRRLASRRETYQRALLGCCCWRRHSGLTGLGLRDTVTTKLNQFYYQRVSIASYANRWYSQRRNVRLSVRLSVTLRYCIKTKKASVMISSTSESQNILVSRNIWFIRKFDRGHPEWGRFLRLGWVRTGDFGDFETVLSQFGKRRADFSRKMHQKRLAAGLYTRTNWGAYSAPKTPSCI